MSSSPLVRTLALTVQLSDAPDAVTLWQRTLELVATLGVTVLGTVKHDFPGGGFTGLVALAESHVAVHTWPERQLVWAELATCGDPRALDIFRAGVSTWGQVVDIA